VVSLSKLAICAIAKNEHLGLREWVAYHRVVGVEHFYIYDNDSQIPVAKTLAKEIASGYVTCVPFPGLSQQMPSYTDCLRRFGDDNKWIAFIDCDEFLVPKQTDNIVDVLEMYPFSHHVAGLQVNWVLFGSSGHLTPPDGLIIENYTQSTGKDWADNLHTKAIVMPQYTIRAGSNPHYFSYKQGYFSIGENQQLVTNAFSAVHCNEWLQINHYTTKSLQEFETKLAKGRADAAHLAGTNMDNFHKLNAGCTEKDTSIQRFIEPTKRLLENG
jgi:Glycosyltransferase family 92